MGLTLADLRFGFPGQPVLEGLTLDIPAGRRVAIVGANGSGKSTLARCLAGILPAEGVAWQGRPLAALPRAERAGLVQLVGQRPDLHLSGRAATVRGEVAFGPENLALPRAEIAARVEAALDLMGLAGLAGRDPRRLSGGETQRLVLAAALAMRPRLLVLDEPVTDLDHAAREGLMARLAALDPGLTVVALDVTAAHWPGMDALWRLEGGRLHPVLPEAVPAPEPPAWKGGAALLSVRGVAFAYDRPLLSGVGFEVPAGVAVAVTGPNGAGKSTLMRLIAGLSRPSAGTIRLAGLDTAATPPRQLAAALGMVFQNADRQFTAATLLDEAAMAPRLHGMADPQGAARRALAAAGLEEAAGRHPFDLHNGARRLAAVAAAVAHEPRLLILDETQRGLDADHLARLERLIRARRQAGAAVLFVCHDEGFVRRNATHRLAVAGGGARLERA